MKRELTCILCPRGCGLTVEVEGERVTVTGNGCARGIQYGTDECVNPTRTVTSTLRVSNRTDTMVSVKTSCPVPKSRMAEVMEHLRAASVPAPVAIGDTLLRDVCGADILATKTIP